ncbi:class I SAM-dependent methyltransferase [Polycladidibacter hongkongensis]|uniref:class I SAM-dependent methyltransferase n=1 Tax=Polycladidibacter hongkongensis TaxID=1647556 RepID=UPI0008338B7F|nr:class I SAM-dependent methyltransferase [Pseudovibrio hongkongensis]
MKDPALETLLLPLQNEAVAMPTSGAVFLRARMGSPMRSLDAANLLCQQSFAPDKDALEVAGFSVSEELPQSAPLVLVLPPRQRGEARALLAKAVALAKPVSGVVVAAVTNTEGAKTAEGDLAKLLPLAGKLSKNKSRVFWGQAQEVDEALLAQWVGLDAPRDILDGRFRSRPGLFAWDHIDPASQLLVNTLPTNLSGVGADLGAGFGVLAAEVLRKCPKVKMLDLYEAEKRALDLARDNIEAMQSEALREYYWQDVTKGLRKPYDFIVSNPPFHTGKADRADLGQGFIRAAARGLRVGGHLWMVANRHLPYEDTLDKTFGSYKILADEGGYKVIHAIKAGR